MIGKLMTQNISQWRSFFERYEGKVQALAIRFISLSPSEL